SPSAFTMTVTGGHPSPASFPGSSSGTQVTIDAGAAFTVGETGAVVNNYNQTTSGNCAGPIAAGQTATCTVTNTAKPATLTVVKHVDNTQGGTASASDFTITVTGAGASPSTFPGSESGTPVTLQPGQQYSVTESGPTGYVESDSANCSGSLGPGGSATCT